MPSRAPIWALVLVVLLLVLQTSVVPRWPSSYPDEPFVLDAGKLALQPAAPASTAWVPHESRGYRPLHSFGCTLQYAAFETSGGSLVASRLVLAASRLLLFLGLWLWWRTCGFDGIWALFGAAGGVLETALGMSVAVGRVDLNVCLAAVSILLLVRHGTAAGVPRARGLLAFFLAGILLSLLLVFWFSGVLLAPVLLGVVLSLLLRLAERKSAFRAFAAFAAGGSAAAALLALAVWSRPELLGDLLTDLNAGPKGGLPQVAALLTRCLILTPFLTVAVVVAGLARRSWLVMTLLGVTWLGVSFDRVYPFRTLYALFAFALVLPLFLEGPIPRFPLRLARASIVLSLLLNASVSSVVRPFVAWRDGTGNERSEIALGVARLVESANLKSTSLAVYDDSYALTEEGFRRGWRLFHLPAFETMKADEFGEKMGLDVFVLATPEARRPQAEVKMQDPARFRELYRLAGRVESTPGRSVPRPLSYIYLGGGNHLGPFEVWVRR